MSHPDDFLGMKSGNDWGRALDIAGNPGEMNPKQTIDKNEGLLFPKDLQDGRFYPEAISFSIYERAGYNFEEFIDCVVQGYTSSGNGSVVKEATKAVPTAEKVEALKANQQSKSIDGGLADKVTSGWNFLKDVGQELGDIPSDFKRGWEKFLAGGPRPNVTGPAGSGFLNASDSILNTAFGGITVGNQLEKFKGAALAGLGNLSVTQKKRLVEKFKNPTSRLVRTIKLQMPESVIFNEQVDWTSTDLGLIGALRDGAIGPATAAAAAGNAGKMVGGAIGGLVGMLPGLGGGAAMLVGSLLGGESGIAAGIESSFNFKANPYKEQAFQGMPFRPFEFNFIFRPRSAEEAQTAKQIINEFRAYSKPRYKEGTETSGVFSYPHEFRIEFLSLDPSGKRYIANKNLPAIKYCICKGINVNYSPQGWRTLPNSSSVDIQLTLSFEETEIVTQEDVQGQSKFGDFKDRENIEF